MKKQSRSQRSRLQDFREFNQWLRKRVRSQLAGEEYVFTREDFGKISGSVGMTNRLILFPQPDFDQDSENFSTRKALGCD